MPHLDIHNLPREARGAGGGREKEGGREREATRQAEEMRRARAPSTHPRACTLHSTVRMHARAGMGVRPLGFWRCGAARGWRAPSSAAPPHSLTSAATALLPHSLS